MRQERFTRWAYLPSGWAENVRITSENGIITAVDVGVTGTGHDIALPGVCNLHSHAFQRAMAGLTETRGPGDDSFWSWRQVMYDFLATMTPDQMQQTATLAFREMRARGFNRVCEFHYLHHGPDGRAYDNPAEMAERLIAAAQEADIALTLLPVFYAHSDFGGQPPTEGQRRFVHTPDAFARLVDHLRGLDVPDLVVGVAAHSLRAVTEAELRDLVTLVGDQPLHIHIAEQTREVEACLAHTGQRPVEWLLSHFDLGPTWCLVHATHMTHQETVDLAATGAVAGLCPITEANLGDGIFNMADYQRARGAWGVGSDSNVLISLPQELRMLEYGQRLFHRARNVMAAPSQSTGQALFDAALMGGAQAGGVPASAIAVGERDDLTVLDGMLVNLRDKAENQIFDSWIFAGL